MEVDQEIVNREFSGFPQSRINEIIRVLGASQHHSIPYLQYKFSMNQTEAENTIWLINYKSLDDYPLIPNVTPEEVTRMIDESSVGTSLQYFYDKYGGSFKAYVNGFMIETKYHHIDKTKKTRLFEYKDKRRHTVSDDSYYQILKVLNESNQTVGTIAEILGCSTSTIYRLVTKMVERGLIKSYLIKGRKIVGW